MGINGAWGSSGDDASHFHSGSRSPILPTSRSHSPSGEKPSLPSWSNSRKSGGGGGGPGAGIGGGGSSGANGYSSFGARKFLGKHLRKLSTSLPTYSPLSPGTPATPFHYRSIGRLNLLCYRRSKTSSFLLLLVGLMLFVFTYVHHNPVSSKLRGVSGGSKVVIILAANQGGGVMTWKGPKEWAVERDSIANKKAYAERWGYHLEIKDMSTKKRYAHEWRESWEKVDVIKQTMRQHPKAEW